LWEFLRDLTLPVLQIADGEVKEGPRSSGFLVQDGDKVFAFAAGHGVNGSAWAFEVPNPPGLFQKAMLIIPSPTWGNMVTISLETGSTQSLDFAWGKVNMENLRRDLRSQGRSTVLTICDCAIDGVPNHSDEYNFFALSRVDLLPAGVLLDDGRRSSDPVLLREPAFEFGMKFTGEVEDTGLYRFALARRHMGHAYYRGASGAPIANQNGEVVSMLLGGDVRTNEVYGLPLSKYARLPRGMCT
jgi:hypothetical protein